MAHSWSFLANQKARNAIVGAENLLNIHSQSYEQFNQQSRSETTELQITQKSNTTNFKGYASVQGGSPPLM